MRKKFIPIDYNEELADIAEKKGFKQDAENLLLSMLYKIQDSYNNFQTVKREVPNKDEFIKSIVNSVQADCQDIIIAEPRSQEEQELKENKCTIKTEEDMKTELKKVISYPNEKTLLYGISKIALPPIMNGRSMEDNAIITTINIGKCISNSEVIRDFNGWSWYILPNEIESTECNIVYTFLLFLLGHDLLENANVERIKSFVSPEFFQELTNVSLQFYQSYDKTANEDLLKRLSYSKEKLEKMKNQQDYLHEINEKKKELLDELNSIETALKDPRRLREQYLRYNDKRPNEEKIFSISHYEDMIVRRKDEIFETIKEYNKMQNQEEFLNERERIQYEIKMYEGQTDITKLQKEFLKHFEMIIDNTTDRRKILDLIYETRYLKFLPNCPMNLSDIEEKLIAKAIRNRIIAPVSNNDFLDYRLLKGIFNTQVINLQNLYIKLGALGNIIKVEIYDGDMLENKYDVALQEGTTIEIRKSKKRKIFV